MTRLGGATTRAETGATSSGGGVGDGADSGPVGPGIWEAVAVGMLLGARLRGLDAVGACAAIAVGVVALVRVRRRILCVAAAAIAAAGLASATAGLQAAAMLQGDEPVHAVGIVGADPTGTATTPGRVVVRLPGRRLLVHAAGLAPMGATVAVTGTAVPVRGDDAARQRAFDDRIAGEVPHAEVRLLAPPPALVAVPTALRRRLERAVTAALDRDAAGLALGLLIGDDQLLGHNDVVAFRTAGLSHLLVASGSNLAFVLGAAAAVLSWLPTTPRQRVVVSAGVGLVYVAITRFEPSIVRAAVMAALALVATWSGFVRDPRRGIAIAVCVLVACDPFLARRLGFVLSVVASAAIVWLARPLGDRLRWLGPRWLVDAAAVTLVAQAAVVPVVCAASGRISLAGFVTNLPALALAGALTVGLVGLGAVSLIRPDAFALAGPGLHMLLGLGRLGAELPGAELTVPNGGLVAAGMTVVACGLCLRIRCGRARSASVPSRPTGPSGAIPEPPGPSRYARPP